MRVDDCCGGVAAHGEQPSCTCCRDVCGGEPLYCGSALEFMGAEEGPAGLPFECSRLLGHDGPHCHDGVSVNRQEARAIPWAMAWGNPCDHEWISAKSQVVEGGRLCPKCFAIRRDQPWERD